MDFEGTYMDMLSEDTLVDSIALTQPVQFSQSIPPKRTANFTQQEDIQLCLSWEAVSSDPIISNEQPGKAYWTRITEHFHANKTFEFDRNKTSLEHRWGKIQRECKKFQGLFEDVQRRHPSGVPYQEHLLEAQLAYSGGKKRGFPLLYCWLKVRNSQKFQSINPREKKKAANAKKHMTSNATSSNPINVDEAEAQGMGSPQTPDSSQIIARPIGRKRAMEQLKNKGGDGGSYKNVVEELLVEKEEERKMKDLRWQEAKTMHERRISVEEKRLQWEQEQKIMFCDVNTLDVDQKNYVLAMRAQITARKMAEFSQSLSGSSGGNHNAGDDLCGGDASI